ncbi:MAG: oligosaccharide flippase family protein [Acidobacteriota bacterium]
MSAQTTPGVPGPTTEQRVLRSTLAAYGSQFGRMALRIGWDLALARLVLPSAHGVFALAWSIVFLASLVRDVGLGYELVRDARRPYGTVFHWQIRAGLLVTAALALLSPLTAQMDPDLPAVLAVLSLYVLFDALAVVPRLFFERELAVGRLVMPEIVRGAVVTGLAIALAWRGAGVWSMVAGELAGAALYAALLWRRVWGKVPLHAEKGLTRELLRKSSLLFVIAFAANSTPYVGRFVVEAFGGTFMVGQFEKAQTWAMRLQVLVMPAILRVLYPALMEYRDRRDRFIGAYRLGTASILALETLAAYFLFFNAETVMLHVLAGKNWAPAIPLLRILCFVPLLDPFSRLGGELLKTRHEDKLWLLITTLNLACLLAFGIVLSARLGPSGMAWANYLMLGNLIMTWRMWRLCGPDFWRLLRELLLMYVTPLPLFALVAWLFPMEGWPRFGASFLAVGLAALVPLKLLWRPLREFFAVTEDASSTAPDAAPDAAPGVAPEVPA